MKKLISMVGLLGVLSVASAGEYVNRSFIQGDVQSFTIVANTTWTNSYPGSTFTNYAGTLVILTNAVALSPHQNRFVTQDVPMGDFGLLYGADTNLLTAPINAKVFIQVIGPSGQTAAANLFTFTPIFADGQPQDSASLVVSATLTSGARKTVISFLPATFLGASAIRVTQVVNADADATLTVEDIRLCGWSQ